MGRSIARPRSGDFAQQGAVVAALAATVAVNGLANSLPLNGQTTGEISDRFPLLITPPGYVFAIWGLIYSGLLAYAAYQALPPQRGDARLRAIVWPFLLSCAANIAWILLWHSNQYVLTLGAMIGLLLALITVDLRLGRVRGAPWAEQLFVRLPFSIYLGWISVATIVNATVAFTAAGWDGSGISAETWTTGLIAVGAALGMAQGAGRGQVGYPLTLAWAFAGVALKNAGTPFVGTAAWVAVAVTLVSAGVAVVRARP